MQMAAVAQSDAPEMDELKPGTQLLHGQYRIESFLSSGGFGITYLARDSLDRPVVIKECFPSAFCQRFGTSVATRSRSKQSDFRAIVKLFVREAWSLSKLTHPNIVGVHQIFEDNGTAYMALDHIDGFDLMQTIENDSMKLPPEKISDVLGKILDAVGFVHEQDMLHRDISPDNILIDRQTGNPVLIDFGAAREKASEVHRSLSELRVVKDGYSPQEFYVTGSTQGPYSDLYALAATFYHLIQGRTPPPAQERLQAIAMEEDDPYVPLGPANMGYEPAFLEAINHALNILPRDRLQSTRDWQRMIAADAAPAQPSEGEAADLGALAARSPEAAPDPARAGGSAPGAETVAALHRKSKLPLLLTSAGTLAILAGLYAIYFGFPGGDGPALPAAEVATPAPVPEAGPEAVAAAPEIAAPEAAAPESAVPESVAPETAAPESVALADPAEAAPAPEIAASPDPAPEAGPDPVAAAALAAVPDGPIALPEAESSAPAPAHLVAAAAAPEPGLPDTVPDTRQPEPLALPEIADPAIPSQVEAEIVAPAPAEPAPAPETVAAAEPLAEQPDISAEPAAVPAAAPQDAAPAPEIVSETASLYLPFLHDDAAATTIAALSTGAEDWMAAGQRIVDVNGTPIRTFEDIGTLLRAEIAAAVAAGAETVEAVLGVEAIPGAELIRKPVTLPIVPEITVRRGATFQIVPTEAGLRPMVIEVPWNSVTELQVGDIVHHYLARGEEIPVGADFGALLQREIASGETLLNFVATRDGVVWLVSLAVDTGN